MSLIDDVLIAVEDRERIGLTELHEILIPSTKQAVYSAVGRLVKRNFLKNSAKEISITDRGKDYIYTSLDAIKKFEQNDRPFTLVIFEIPERQKVTREKFRTSLNQLGFGSLKRGVMLGTTGSVDEPMKVVSDLGLQDRVVVLGVESVAAVMASRFVPWNFPKINHTYQQFMDRASGLISKSQHESVRVKAKQLVLQFARICKFDPVLPKQLTNRDYLGYRAHELYLKLKPLCY